MKTLLPLLMLLVWCPVVNAEGTGWLLTTDYSTFGRARSLDLVDPWTVSGDLAVIPGDPAGRHHDGRVYIVGRGGANLVQIYDPQAGFSLVREFSIGTGRNPQDIAFDTTGEAYVSCYDQAVLLRVDVEAGTVLETYDTSLFADADGIPETAWMLARGDLLYIVCQKLDWFAPTGPGALLVFDMAAEAWVDMDPASPGTQPIALTGGNPYTRIEAVDDGSGGVHLRVGCAGFFGVQDGGIEEIDPVTGSSLGYLATEPELGGDILTFTSTGDDVHVLVSNVSGITSLRSFDLSDRLVTVLATATDYYYADLAWDGDFQLFLADRTIGAAGLRVFDEASGAELTAGPIPTGLKPFQFVMQDTEDYSAVLPPRANGLKLSAPYPNPCNPAADLLVTGKPGQNIRVGVFDLAGRRLQDGVLSTDSAGKAIFRFDGRDHRGRSLPAGIYRVVVQDETGFAARTLTLLK